jgi:hypothetical protein
MSRVEPNEGAPISFLTAAAAARAIRRDLRAVKRDLQAALADERQAEARRLQSEEARLRDEYQRLIWEVVQREERSAHATAGFETVTG